MQNNGFELGISSENIKGKDFTWNTSFNITFNRNKVMKIFNGTPTPYGFASWLAEGEELGAFRGYVVEKSSNLLMKLQLLTLRQKQKDLLTIR
jgi:hypothetical protein